MSSDSDSDDDIKIKKYVEAIDTILLNDSMYQKNGAVDGVEKENIKKVTPKTQRYIVEDNINNGIDLNFPESLQNHLAKKLTEMLEQRYEFYDATIENKPENKIRKYKNRVKLLKGYDCYVNPYNNFEYGTKGPDKKPIIKRRVVDKTTNTDFKEKNYLKLIAVDGNHILSGEEVRTWEKKKERSGKMFYYKMDSNGVLHAKEQINEFTELRRKNKWNESKIKMFKSN